MDSTHLAVKTFLPNYHILSSQRVVCIRIQTRVSWYNSSYIHMPSDFCLHYNSEHIQSFRSIFKWAEQKLNNFNSKIRIKKVMWRHWRHERLPGYLVHQQPSWLLKPGRNFACFVFLRAHMCMDGCAHVLQLSMTSFGAQDRGAGLQRERGLLSLSVCNCVRSQQKWTGLSEEPRITKIRNSCRMIRSLRAMQAQKCAGHHRQVFRH